MWRKPVGLGAMRTRTLMHVTIVGTAVEFGAHVSVGRRDPHRDRPHRGDRRRLRAGLHAEPADVAADGAQAGGDRRASASGGARPAIGGVVCHALYLCNLAAPDDAIYEKSIATMRATRRRRDGDRRRRRDLPRRLAPRRRASRRASTARRRRSRRSSSGATATPGCCIENSAGTGATIGRSLEELATLVDRLDGHPRLGICLDSCHLYASGYDVTDPAARRRARRRARRADRPRPPARAARQRQRDAARLEPRPAREHPRGRDRRGPRRLPRPPGASRSLGAYLEVPGVDRRTASAAESS